MNNNSELVFPPAVRRAQTERGTAQAFDRKVAGGFPNTVTPEMPINQPCAGELPQAAPLQFLKR